MAKGTPVKTKVDALKYVFITGEGRNNAQKGQEPRMQFVASILTKKDSEVHKHMKAQIDAEWKRYKEEFNVKGLPNSIGIKDEMMPDPKGEIDPNTEEIKKVPTGNVLITFKTNTKWPDSSDQIVKVFANKLDGAGKKYAADITDSVRAADWSIGDGSTGIIHGSAMGNNVGGDHKVTLYLSAVQLAKLAKYEGSAVDVEEIDADIIDIDEEVGTEEETSTPPL